MCSYMINDGYMFRSLWSRNITSFNTLYFIFVYSYHNLVRMAQNLLEEYLLPLFKYIAFNSRDNSYSPWFNLFVVDDVGNIYIYSINDAISIKGSLARLWCVFANGSCRCCSDRVFILYRPYFARHFYLGVERLGLKSCYSHLCKSAGSTGFGTKFLSTWPYAPNF